MDKAEHRFVGRETELDSFRHMLRKPRGKQRLKFIWGPGGIGKTWLVQRILDEAANHNELLVPRKLIDMYSTGSRHIEGVIEIIVERLRSLVIRGTFTEYDKAKNELEEARAVEGYSKEDIEAKLETLTEVFRQCLRQIGNKKSIVLAFDTFEHIQDGPVGKWILSENGLQMPGVLCIIASRKPNSSDPDQRSISGLTLDEALNFYDNYLDIKSERSPEHIDYIQKLNDKVKRNPLLLGLALLWFGPTRISTEELDQLSQSEFEKRIISWLHPASSSMGTIYPGGGELGEPVRQTLVCMAYLNRRFNRFFLDRLVQGKYVMGADVEQIWEELQFRLPDFFYVKERPEGEIQLHDKLAEILRVYVLPYNFEDILGENLQQFARDVVTWYDNLITSANSEIFKDILRVEKLAYVLLLDILSDTQQPELKETEEARRLAYLLQPDFVLAKELLGRYKRYRSDILDRLILNEIGQEIVEKFPTSDQYEVYTTLAEIAARVYLREQSREHWDRAFAVAKVNNNSEQQIIALIGRHNSTWQTNPDQSLEVLHQALTICDEVEYLRPRVLYEVGFAHRHLENLEEAVDWYEQALEMAKRYKDRTSAVTPTILNDMGYALLLTGNYDKAEAHIRMAAVLRERNRDILQVQLIEKEHQLERQLATEERERLAEEKGALVDQLHNATLRLGMTYNTLGQLARYTGDIANSTIYYSEALSVFRRVGEYSWQAKALYGRGDAHRQLALNLQHQEREESSQDYDERAFNDIHASLELCERFGFVELRAIIHRRLGRLFHDRALRITNDPNEQFKLLKQALNHFETGLQIARENNDTLEELENLTEIAFLSDDFIAVYRQRNPNKQLKKIEKAEVAGYIERLRRGIDAHRTDQPCIYQFPVFENLLKIELGAFNYELGDLDQALSHYLEGFTGLASDPGYGSARCRAHIDHLFRNIRQLSDPGLKNRWYESFIKKWQTTVMQRGETKSVAQAHPKMIEQFELHAMFE